MDLSQTRHFGAHREGTFKISSEPCYGHSRKLDLLEIKDIPYPATWKPRKPRDSLMSQVAPQSSVLLSLLPFDGNKPTPLDQLLDFRELPQFSLRHSQSQTSLIEPLPNQQSLNEHSEEEETDYQTATGLSKFFTLSPLLSIQSLLLCHS